MRKKTTTNPANKTAWHQKASPPNNPSPKKTKKMTPLTKVHLYQPKTLSGASKLKKRRQTQRIRTLSYYPFRYAIQAQDMRQKSLMKISVKMKSLCREATLYANKSQDKPTNMQRL